MDPVQTEKDNERVKARLEKLLNRLPGLVYRCRIEEGFQLTLEYASSGSENLLGIPAEDMVEKRWNTIERMTVPADLKGMRSTICDSIVAHEPYQVMYRLLLPGGRVKWVWDQGEAIYDDDGTPLYLEGLMMDVSEQKFQELALQDENRQLKLSVEHADCLGSIVGKSEAMHKVYSLILKAAETDTNVIIYGETGCGKDIVARAIHNYSGRKGAYVPVNCGAIPENLLESEFFGFTRGAFTGAERAREGLLLAAHKGTLFLDEVGDLPLVMQGAFLRALELRRFRPVGEVHEVDSDFRLVAATNRDLEGMARTGQFRGDLLYRLQGITIVIPPLRERRDEIPGLARQAVTAFCLRNDLPEKA